MKVIYSPENGSIISWVYLNIKEKWPSVLSILMDLLGIDSNIMSYSQIWCMPMKSSGELVWLFDILSVSEFHAFNDLRQVREAAKFPPVLLSCPSQILMQP